MSEQLEQKPLEHARARLRLLFDEGTFTELDSRWQNKNDPVPVVCGFGLINEAPAYAFSQDITVCNGAVGKAHGEKIEKIYQLAAQNGAPIVGVFDSDGVILGERLAAMDAVSQVLALANDLSGVVPQIAVVAGACVGSAALIAGAADAVIAVKDADYYLTKESSAAADIVADTVEEALQKARTLLEYLPANNLSAPAFFETVSPAAQTATAASDVAALLADAGSLCPLYGEETAFARIGGTVCGIVTLAEETISGKLASRAARFVRLCDAFSLPIITVVDAAAFACLKGTLKITQAYAEATTGKITVVAGKAYGAVYIAVAGKAAGADTVLAFENASLAALAPETAICLEWEDRLKEMTDPTSQRAALAEEYRLAECTAQKAAAEGAVTEIVNDNTVRDTVIAHLQMLCGKRVSKLPKKHTNIRL